MTEPLTQLAEAMEASGTAALASGALTSHAESSDSDSDSDAGASSDSSSDSSDSDADAAADGEPRAKRRKVAALAPAEVFGSDSRIVKTEMYDAAAAAWVVLHLAPAHLQPSWNGTVQGRTWSGTLHDYVNALKKQVQRWMKNGGEVTYKLGERTAAAGAGRMNAHGGLGYQNFCRSIRGLLAATFYWDVDMKNAQPTILLQLALKKHAGGAQGLEVSQAGQIRLEPRRLHGADHAHAGLQPQRCEGAHHRALLWTGPQKDG